MGRIIIVDDNDNIIGHKKRDELASGDIYRVSALWLTNSNGEILIARRAYSKSYSPGKWSCAVTGTVDEGETYKENIVKETEEEIGLKNIKPIEGPSGRTIGEHNYFYKWYLLQLDKAAEDFKIDKREVDEVRWITKKQLVKEVKENPNEFISNMGEWRDMFD